MKLTCPKSKRHKRFAASAHIVQDWQVDSDCDFVKVLEDCTDVIHSPDKDDVITCLTCGADAIKED